MESTISIIKLTSIIHMTIIIIVVVVVVVVVLPPLLLITNIKQIMVPDGSGQRRL